ncbi:TPA: hypothetical protein ACIBE3_004419 [Salmonella enterica subsp. enterica serovar Reading]
MTVFLAVYTPTGGQMNGRREVPRQQNDNAFRRPVAGPGLIISRCIWQNNTKGSGDTVLALNHAEKEMLERKTARWVYEQGRGVTAEEVAGRFRLNIHTARFVIHGIMKRTEYAVH